MMRTTTEDIVLRGKTLRAGDNLCLWYPSANRDSDAIDNPDTFDIEQYKVVIKYASSEGDNWWVTMDSTQDLEFALEEGAKRGLVLFSSTVVVDTSSPKPPSSPPPVSTTLDSHSKVPVAKATSTAPATKSTSKTLAAKSTRKATAAKSTSKATAAKSTSKATAATSTSQVPKKKAPVATEHNPFMKRGKTGGGEGCLLEMLAQLRVSLKMETPTRDEVMMYSDYGDSPEGFKKALGKLRVKRLVCYPVVAQSP